jgi:hypothetical protein
MKLSEIMLKEGIMRKFGALFVFLSVGLFILCAAPPVFCQSYQTDTEIMPIDSNDLSSDADVYLEATSDEMLFPKPPAKKGTLVVINTSSYCADGSLDGQPLFTGLNPGYKVTFTRKIPYGTHKFEARQCNGGSIRWNPITYTQGSSYTITLTN